jgi:hypothetical protein
MVRMDSYRGKLGVGVFGGMAKASANAGVSPLRFASVEMTGFRVALVETTGLWTLGCLFAA